MFKSFVAEAVVSYSFIEIIQGTETGMSVPDSVYELVEKFDSDKARFTHPNYNEAQLRQEFVNPLFDALGWEIGDSKQVLHEAGIRSGGTIKHPDYSFLAGHRRAFYVETKKPFVDIRNSVDPALQIRSYGWSGNTEIGILTNFREFSVYDCRIEPSGDDLPGTARQLYLTYEDYLDDWEENLGLFTRDSVLERNHRRVLEDKPAGVLRVDEAFLRQLESWRDRLAEHIFKQAKFLDITLDTRRLNELVTRTINRIVFLRIAEDRNLEPPGRLDIATRARSNIYSKLKSQFRAADKRYNSGLFHFDPEAVDRGEADELAMDIHINDDVISHIIQDLYPPKSLYQFSVISADILGQVYERFLGKVIEVTGPDDVSIDDKPEVRKAGGVYYTPEYIVDYIVENTVGKLLEGKTPEEAEKLRILDPACGSGSFLVGAFEYLLDWHLRQYEKQAKRYRNRILHTRDGIVMKTREKKGILLNNIYGVDLDPNAVEVCKLALLLKMLEHENVATRHEADLDATDEQILPDLGGNIKCGNSLVGSDFYAGKDWEEIDEAEYYRINPFDWESREEGFGEIMAAGGFDAVIGNPPYIPIEDINESQRRYFQRQFPQLKRKYDTSVIFVLAGLAKLSTNGLLGYISSITWQTGTNYRKLRAFLFENAGLYKLVNLPFKVFDDAYVDTGVYIFSKCPRSHYFVYQFDKKTKEPSLYDLPYSTAETSRVAAPDYKIIIDANAFDILEGIVNLVSICHLGAFTISTQGLSGSKYQRVTNVEQPDILPFLESGQVYRYELQIGSISLVTLHDKPSLQRYYGAKTKLLVRRLVNRQDRLMVGYTSEALVFKKDINPFIISSDSWNPKYVLGILNSRLISYLYVKTSSISTKNDFRQTTLTELRQLPVRKIDFDNPDDVTMRDKMVELVDKMLELHGQLQLDNSILRGVVELQIERTDREIDDLVYKLYDLTSEEIAIVEGRGS